MPVAFSSFRTSFVMGLSAMSLNQDKPRCVTNTRPAPDEAFAFVRLATEALMAALDRMLEQAPDVLNRFLEPVRSPLLGKLVPKRSEVAGVEITDQPRFPQVGNQLNSDGLVL